MAFYEVVIEYKGFHIMQFEAPGQVEALEMGAEKFDDLAKGSLALDDIEVVGVSACPPDMSGKHDMDERV